VQQPFGAVKAVHGFARGAAAAGMGLEPAAGAQYVSFPSRHAGGGVTAFSYRPNSATAASAGVLVLTDVYGVRDRKNQLWMEAFAEASGVVLLAPDLFRGVPWDEHTFGGDTQSPQYEAWRRENYVPERVLADIEDGARYLAASSESRNALGVVGFCFGGGRLLEAISGACDLGGAVSAAVAFYPTRLTDAQSVRAGLETADIPTLIIQGNLDQISPPALAAEVGCVQTPLPIAHDMRRASVVVQV
jgi:dienelactone hydrolase